LRPQTAPAPAILERTNGVIVRVLESAATARGYLGDGDGAWDARRACPSEEGTLPKAAAERAKTSERAAQITFPRTFSIRERRIFGGRRLDLAGGDRREPDAR
jgi:hypothetical protein